MSDNKSSLRIPAQRFPRAQSREPHWVEIFADRVAEDLKQVLQEDMDWMTSDPILDRLNKLREAEAVRQPTDDPRADVPVEFRKAS